MRAVYARAGTEYMDLPELQDAIQRLDGVVSATMRWPDPDGPIMLRVTFTPEAQRAAIAGQVLTLVRKADVVDQQTVEVDQPPTSEPVPIPHRGSRPVLIEITLSDHGLDMNVSVVLEADRRRVTGYADGITAPGADLRTAALATLNAVRNFLPDDVRMELEWLGVTETGTVQGAKVVQAGVACVTVSRGAEMLYGSAPVRGDARDAAARATLDALNRRLSQLAGAA